MLPESSQRGRTTRKARKVKEEGMKKGKKRKFGKRNGERKRKERKEE